MGSLNIIPNGTRFGRLTVIEFSRSDRRAFFMVQCDCGKVFETLGNRLKTGNTKSCGCLKSEKSRERGKETIKKAIAATVKHGLKNHPAYQAWKRMKVRCLNKNNANYQHYGARGIVICDEWINDAGAFVRWAIDNGYRKGLSIDRIDNDGPYSPDNCRWVTQKIQCNNTRRNKYFVFEGERLTQSQLADRFGLDQDLVGSRILRGWDLERALGLR